MLADQLRTLLLITSKILSELRTLCLQTPPLQASLNVPSSQHVILSIPSPSEPADTKVRAANEFCGVNDVLHSIHDNSIIFSSVPHGSQVVSDHKSTSAFLKLEQHFTRGDSNVGTTALPGCSSSACPARRAIFVSSLRKVGEEGRGW